MFNWLLGRGATSQDCVSQDCVNYDETCRALAEGCALIDVREADEFASGHVAGARNMPLSRFDPAALPTDRRVVLICLSGARSGRALRQARAAGRKDVAHYSGGVSGWRREGGALTR